MARLSIDRQQSRAYARDWAEENHVGPLSRKILAAARAQVPVKTGRLRGSLHIDRDMLPLRVTARVGSNVSYAHLIHVGAREHVILPRRSRKLKFFWRRIGRWVTLARVNHPGFEGTAYLTRPLLVYGTAAGFRVTIFPTAV